MISKFSKYAKIFALGLTLLVAVPMAISAAPSGEATASLATQNSNKAFNGGGSAPKRSRHHKRRRTRRHSHKH
jgi:hypothetical protein